ncbi:RNA polymerase sigma factor [Ruegeria sp. MALMAid1280]|uniref:RNA polymerase sigma factor n=1 Tax=Ruegeria sp. MALMAid1280 TaxID=3411634 RepID=UPI003B9EBD70
MIHLDSKTVKAARHGDRAALADVVKAVERPVFGLAIRMLADRFAAEDATQEILVKIITHLGTLRDDAAAGGWALKLATRHLVATRKRSRIETMRLSFRDFTSDLESGLVDVDEAHLDNAVTAIAIEEIKIGCTLAMLTCLKRSLRIAYILGDIFEMSDREAADALQISSSAFRQRLHRARVDVTQFLQSSCGHVSQNAACRCENRLAAAQSSGRITPGTRTYDLDTPPVDIRELRIHVRRLEEGRRAAALMRSNPAFPTKVGALVLEALK